MNSTELKNYYSKDILSFVSINYCDVNLKPAQLKKLEHYERFTFIKSDIPNKDLLMTIFKEYSPNIVVNLAGQAGVRYSIKNPDVYMCKLM